MTEITQKLLTEEKIPIAPLNGEDFDKLNISVDGYKAQCFICLLYTSPSPRDMRRSRMPSSA